MEYTELGRSGLRVSRLCFGGCPMGRHGWGKVSQDDFIHAIHEALDDGVNFFDSADTYGLGEGEHTLGQALRNRRHEAVIATKFGVRVAEGRTLYDNSPKWIRLALESSLRRLGTDYVDLYQVHYRDGVTPLEEILEELERLQREGKIRHLGLSNVGEADMVELDTLHTAFVSFQNELSLANRVQENMMADVSNRFGLTPLAWGSLGQGILTGKYDLTSKFSSEDRRSRPTYGNFHGERLEHNIRIVTVMRTIAAELGRTVPSIAIRWILDHLAGSVAIVGIKNSDQLRSNANAMDWGLPAEAIERLDAVSSASELKGCEA